MHTYIHIHVGRKIQTYRRTGFRSLAPYLCIFSLLLPLTLSTLVAVLVLGRASSSLPAPVLRGSKRWR